MMMATTRWPGFVQPPLKGGFSVTGPLYLASLAGETTLISTTFTDTRGTVPRPSKTAEKIADLYFSS